ncbi:glutamate--tRNA ligase, partial [Candidatus Bathyarchaeota archaeon]|nr:glutamate--tRNA ligase [Candidatus Bathyarchaeota archaeon]
GEARFLISGQDAKMLKPNFIVRLMELFNIKIENVCEDHVVSSFHSEAYGEARKIGAHLIHWIPENSGLPCEIVMPDNSLVNGLVEDNFRSVFPDKIVQFERFGFARIEKVYGKIVAVFTHR